MPQIQRYCRMCCYWSCLVLLIMIGSVVGKEPTEKSPPPAWAPPKHAKVIGYRFRLPSEDSKEPVPSGFSLLRNAKLDEKQLVKLQHLSAELTAAQVKKLADAMLSPKITTPAACYDPHHIFVFYDEMGKMTGAVEICFSCTGIIVLPELSEAQWYRQDYVALARLTDELGLWKEYQTVAEFERHMVRDKE